MSNPSTYGRIYLSMVCRQRGGAHVANVTGQSASAVSAHLNGTRVPSRTARHAYEVHFGIADVAWDIAQ